MTPPADELSIVGKSLIKPDAFAKVSGQTKFADDLALPRMLFGRILRSPHPHARILHVDTARGRALPAGAAGVGDPDEAMRPAAHVRDDVVFFEANTHLPMEQHAAVAQYAADGKLT